MASSVLPHKFRPSHHSPKIPHDIDLLVPKCRGNESGTGSRNKPFQRATNFASVPKKQASADARLVRLRLPPLVSDFLISCVICPVPDLLISSIMSLLMCPGVGLFFLFHSILTRGPFTHSRTSKMSSSTAPKSNTKSQTSSPLPSTFTDAYKTGYTAASSISSPTMTSPLPESIADTTGYFPEKHQTTDHTIEIYDVPPEGSSHDPLVLFHTALGIPPPKQPKPIKATKKNPHPEKAPPKPKLTPANKGVYHQVLKMEQTMRWKYYFCDWLVTLAMFLQIIVGASVTAFGAGSASHILITAFGAANTALASLLAVLKSQGLPNRIRQDWNGWRELREYIEEKEREIEMIYAGRVGDGKEMELKDVWRL